MNCPKCGFTLDDGAMARSLASKAGKAGRGKAKARPSEQMRAAARVRWDKVKTNHICIPPKPVKPV